MSDRHAELVEELRRRVERRRAEGAYDDPSLSAAPVASTTPVDALLRTGRPLLDRAAAPPGPGRLGRLRKAAARHLAPSRGGWFEEQREFEQRLRGATADLTGRVESERMARERTDDAVRALEEAMARLETQAAQEMAGAARLVEGSLAGLIDRVGMLENRQRADAIERSRPAATAAPAGGAAASTGGGIPPLTDFDYLGFENRFRGSEESVRVRQRKHAARLEGLGTVADLGCGRGEFLEILRDRGIEAVGVDSSAQMVAVARDKGLAAEHGDMFEFLARRPVGSLGGILCSHVVEHLWPADHVRLARLCAAALRPGGVAIFETPNPKSLIAGSVNFSCDPTHLRPVFPETLAFMLEGAGFDQVSIEYLSRVPDERRARPVTGEPAALAGVVRQINEAVQRLDDLVFGDQDYAVVARRGGA